MSYKQEKHGEKGEARTRNILLDHFILHKIIPDIEGRDFMVELHNNVSPVNAIIQSKYFENSNEVIIRKDYVQDEEGTKIDFFALLHTDDLNSNEITYFFSAQEIREKWRLSNRKKGKKRIDYYVFKLNKRDTKKFESFRGIPKADINQRIENGIRRIDEFRNQKNIRLIKAKFKNPIQQVYENYNHELFNTIKNEHIVDKLFETLSEFKDFRRIISWRLIDKISFRENRHTSTHYNQFALNTNHSEILKFFENIDISDKVTLKNSLLFKGVNGANKKVKNIIKTLNENLIFKLGDQKKNTTIDILITHDKHYDCFECKFDNLNFSQSYYSLNKNKEMSGDLWEWMQHAYLYFKFGEYEKAMELYVSIANKAKENKEQVLFFFAKYNQRLAAIKNFEYSYPDLGIELDKLNISPEKKEILNSLTENILLNSYAKSIDELYLKIKDFKQRYSPNDTADLIGRLTAKVAEYSNFIDGNWLVLNNFEEAELLFEKVVESCIISYSMKTEYSCHLYAFDDFLVQLSIHHCSSKKLLGFFQRNDVRKLSYKSKKNYFSVAFSNFFSKDNVDFLYSEICYFDNRTENPDLRIRVNRIFENLCILLTYLDTEFENITLLENIAYFIEKLDFNVHDISILAHPLLAKPNLFTSNELLYLIKVLVSRENLYDGYLLTNCLYTLEEKKYVFPDSERETVSSIIEISINKPRYGILKVLPSLLDEEERNEYKTRIQNKLKNKFNHELYYQSVISGNIANPKLFIDSYLSFFSSISEKKEIPRIFYAKSPFTGIGEPLRDNLNKLVEVILSINDNSLLRKQIIRDITVQFPYYNFIFNLDNFNEEKSFDKFWILENQSEIVLNRIAKNKFIKTHLKEELVKKYHKEISIIFIKYFMD